MTSETNGPEEEGPEEDGPRGAASWAQPVSRLTVPELPSEATNLNVEGRKVVGPLQGFGQMWQKTYLVRLSGTAVTPAEVIKAWKDNFGEFWPEGGDLLFFPVERHYAATATEDLPMSIPECLVDVYELARWKGAGWGRPHAVWRYRPDV